MTAHHAGGDLEVFPFGGFARAQDAFESARIGRERFFHENMHSFLDGVFDVRRAKGGVSGAKHNIARAQAVDRLAITVEPDELAIARHIDFLPILLGQVRMGVGQSVREDIGHGDELHGTAGRLERVGDRATPATAATNDRQPDRVVLGSMHSGQGHSRERRGGGEPSGLLEKIAT